MQSVIKSRVPGIQYFKYVPDYVLERVDLVTVTRLVVFSSKFQYFKYVPDYEDRMLSLLLFQDKLKGESEVVDSGADISVKKDD